MNQKKSSLTGLFLRCQKNSTRKGPGSPSAPQPWITEADQVLPATLKERAWEETAYSLAGELIRRKTGLTLFSSQLLAAKALVEGKIAQLPTGEGKTLAAVVAAMILAHRHGPVHILVFNDYLARRDYNANLPLFAACDLSCGVITGDSSFQERKQAYGKQIVYVAAKEAAFDYLRDFMATTPAQLLFPGFSTALVDEADSLLIDEARVPLVVAGNSSHSPPQLENITRAIATLPEHAVEMDREKNLIWLTDSGTALLEKLLSIENLYAPSHSDLRALVYSGLSAAYLLKKDREYLVKNGQVLVVDPTTGRVAENRRFPYLLAQAVESKEGLPLSIPSMPYTTMNLRDFLLSYPRLSGMTGTAQPATWELRHLYGLEVVLIPPHLPCRRIDHPDALFLTREEREKEVLNCIQRVHSKGQPLLIGTQSVEASEQLSQKLTAQSLPHRVLNARNDEEEAAIIAQAGAPYQITVSTNLAGRGVDIRLGGGGSHSKFVREAGGLFVLGIGINRSRRLDDQLRGRAGRQGDPGESLFFVSLDEIDLETFFPKEEISPKKYLRRAQRLQEGMDAQARSVLYRYSTVVETQRRQVEHYRLSLLKGEKQPDFLRRRDPPAYEALVEKATAAGVHQGERQLTLYYLNTHWASYLGALEDKRAGIHLMLVAGKDPLEEYRRFALSAFAEMEESLIEDVIHDLVTLPLTAQGIDMEQAGLTAATTTWTYQLDDNADQFSRLPQLMRSLKNTVRAPVFTLHRLWLAIRNFRR